MTPLRTALAALALAALALPAWAQPAKPASDTEARVHRMEIWNGPVRTVQYFSQGYSPGEDAALRDLARAEENLAVEDQVIGLRRLYLKNERVLAQRRGQVNPLLYGYSSSYAAGLFPGVITRDYGYGAFAGYPYGVAGFGNVGAAIAYPGAAASLGTATNSLANGVGSECVTKDVLVQGLGVATAPESVARAARAYDAAVARVAESDRLRIALGWGKGPIATVGHERTVGGPVTVTTKDGKTFEGTLTQEDGDWITVETKTDEVTLRKSDVTRITRPKKGEKP